MASQPVPTPFVGFTRLRRSVYNYKPSSTTSDKSSEPDLILVCSWLDAAPKHIAKYTIGYKRLFPTSRIVLITTALADSTINSGPRAQGARIAPVLAVLASLPRSSKVLLHLFSNGGAFTSCLIAGAYRLRTSAALPIAAMVLDSSPGKPEHFRTHTALAMGLPQRPRILYYLMSAGLHVFLLLYRLWKTVTWQTDIITNLRRDMNEEKYVALDVPRVYIYSDGDLMVRHTDIEEHAAEAKRRGYDVKTEFWKGSGHCGHLMKDEKRYWGIVKDIWEEKSTRQIE